MIVNANAGEHLERALAAVFRQTIPPRRTIVVDNLSSDGSTDRAAATFPGVEVIRPGRNLGFAAGNNVAVRAAGDCEWIALLNPDAFPEPDWLENLLHAADENVAYSFFASRLLRATDPEQVDSTGDVYHAYGIAWARDWLRPADEARRPSEEVFSARGAAAFYRRDAFLRVGGFDESLFCFLEDVDLAFRLRLAGEHCLYVPEALVYHVGSATTGYQSSFAVYHYERNLVWTWLKNMPAPLLALYLPSHLVVNVLTSLAAVKRRQTRLVLAAKRDATRGLPRVLRARRGIQARRRVRSLELRRTMATGWRSLIAASRGRL